MKTKTGLSLMISCLILAFFFLSGAQSIRITFRNNCPSTIWPGTQTVNKKPELSTTGFELASTTSTSLDVQAPWNGWFWARIGCSTDDSRRFSCTTTDCTSGQVACNGNGPIPLVSLVEFTIAENGGMDFYAVSLVNGFNLPASMSTKGGIGICHTSSCPVNVNVVCPIELQQKASDGSVIACKSPCEVFKQPQYCCTGSFTTPDTCLPTNYSKIFKYQCPQAYTYAHDDSTSTFNCSGAPNYTITFCP